ncbi:hypothetical protein FIBSPDRAFT_851568 [Athelia psychrophila]|uniref:Uncharacterized protein n=1 Tax=Athelia psychrophila TaxID=1759441 RepID=A0A166KQF7_9AGAM|nr:hypothetical protein FIBSPDRAFT_859713 [Fibularhizoctonia sp. CBS 109695]KZP29208.1 hypothetical protein FIBSPDRAFT_851568 [Fibularhizoctonia sp. CBS 109695]
MYCYHHHYSVPLAYEYRLLSPLLPYPNIVSFKSDHSCPLSLPLPVTVYLVKG